MEFKCDSLFPPFDKEHSYTVMFDPDSNYVAVGQYQFVKVSVSEEQLQKV